MHKMYIKWLCDMAFKCSPKKDSKFIFHYIRLKIKFQITWLFFCYFFSVFSQLQPISCVLVLIFHILFSSASCSLMVAVTNLLLYDSRSSVCVFFFWMLCQTLKPVKADGRPQRVWFCWRFLYDPSFEGSFTSSLSPWLDQYRKSTKK